jgi:hypothetical protein
MKEEHGLDVFFGGCPVCKELCCCNNKSVFCHRKNHCYRKCPATKTNGKQTTLAVKEDSDSEPYHEEMHSIPKPENGQYGIFDLLAAVADMDKSQPLAKQNKNPSGVTASSSSSAGPRKKAKTGKEGLPGGKDLYPSNMLLCEPAYSQYFASSAPESVGNMQILNNKGLPAADSGVDGYTFNNNTMGIIRGGMGGVTDAIALLGQQQKQKAGKFNVGMDPVNFTMMSATDPLLSGFAPTTASAPVSTSSVGASVPGVPTSVAGAYNRLPSIDNNPFSAGAAARDVPRDVPPTFDQALLDSVRSIQQDPFVGAPRPLPSVPRTLSGPASATAPPLSPSPTEPAVATKSTGALEPMNLLALVSSSLDKALQPVPSESLPSSRSSSGTGLAAEAEATAIAAPAVGGAN